MLRRQALQLLEEKIRACSKCEELSTYRTANSYLHVPGVGNESARVAVIGEAPGENEAKKGEPFVGKAGNLLNNILKAAGFPREEVFIMNMVKCRPPGNRDPEPQEIENCRRFLDLQLKVIDPEWIICFGRISSVHLLGLEGDTPIGSLRGKIHDYHGRKVVCTYHPSYVLHQSGKPEKMREAKQAIWTDLQPVILALHPNTGVV